MIFKWKILYISLHFLLFFSYTPTFILLVPSFLLFFAQTCSTFECLLCACNIFETDTRRANEKFSLAQLNPIVWEPKDAFSQGFGKT